MDKWNQIAKPIVVLASICVVVTGALAMTNQYTAPKIAALAAAAAAEAREELMPGISFELVDCDAPNISEAYQAEDGSVILTALSKGYGGTFVTMVAFDGNGNIVRVKVQEHAETKGIGDKVEAESFWGQYSGKPAEALALDVDIDRVSGATISSKAVNNGVNSAIVGYQMLGGTYVAPEPSDNSEVLSSVGADLSQTTQLDVSHLEDVLAAYTQEDQLILLTTGTGYDGEVSVATSFQEDGVVTKVALGENEETVGRGDRVAGDFMNQFQGVNAPLDFDKDIDAVSEATISSKAVVEAVNKAISAFPQAISAPVIEAETEGMSEEEEAEFYADQRDSFLSGVTDYEEVILETPVENLVEFFRSVDQEYYVAITKGTGHYDLLDVLVALDAQGNVVKVQMHEPNVNPNTAPAVFDDNLDFFQQFEGKNTLIDFETEIDAVTGATDSSVAVSEGVNVALKAFASITE